MKKEIIEDEEGNKTIVTFDEGIEIYEAADGDGSKTIKTLDANHNIIRSTHYNGSGHITEYVIYEFNDAGDDIGWKAHTPDDILIHRCETSYDDQGLIEMRHYNSEDCLESTWRETYDENKKVSLRMFDAQGRLIK